MIELPDPPHNSPITIEHRGEAIGLSWPTGIRGCSRGANTVALVVLAPFALVAVAGVLSSLAVFIPHLAFRLPPETVIGRFLVFAVSAGFLWVYYRASANRRRFRATELLVIDGNAIVHSPSRRVPRFPYAEAKAFVEELGHLSEDAQALVRLGACVFVDRYEVKDIALEGKGSFGIVSVKTGGYDVDIGRGLSHADREWLLEILRRWREAGPAAPLPHLDRRPSGN